MAVTQAHPAARSGNLAKHRSQNPLQRRLLAQFHARIAALTADALTGGPAAPRVVEVGCGEGFVLAALGEHLPRTRYLGLELRAEALPLAAAQAPHAGLGRADALRLPLADAAADVTLCLEVLEHLPDPWAAVRELLRVTRGSLIVSEIGRAHV